jgi:hypothetical protein
MPFCIFYEFTETIDVFIDYEMFPTAIRNSALFNTLLPPVGGKC